MKSTKELNSFVSIQEDQYIPINRILTPNKLSDPLELSQLLIIYNQDLPIEIEGYVLPNGLIFYEVTGLGRYSLDADRQLGYHSVLAKVICISKLVPKNYFLISNKNKIYLKDKRDPDQEKSHYRYNQKGKNEELEIFQLLGVEYLNPRLLIENLSDWDLFILKRSDRTKRDLSSCSLKFKEFYQYGYFYELEGIEYVQMHRLIRAIIDDVAARRFRVSYGSSFPRDSIDFVLFKIETALINQGFLKH